MGYDETTNLKLKKPTIGTSKTEWPGYINGNFDAIDVEMTNRHKVNADIVPDADNSRSLGSALRRLLNGFFNQITLGGVTRTTWPSPGSATLSMDDTYNNGSVVVVDNTDVAYQLAAGRKVKITDAAQASIMSLSSGQIAFPATAAPSGDPNTLDDYEEGDAVVALACGTSGSIALAGGYSTLAYTKIGRLVTLTGYIYVESVSSPVGSVTLTGLPFVCLPTYGKYQSVAVIHGTSLAATCTALMSKIAYNTATLPIYTRFASGVAASNAADIQTGTQLTFHLIYYAA